MTLASTLARSLLALWLPVVSIAAHAGLIEEMVALDRAYIPALALTTQGKAAESRRALEILEGRWVQFRSTPSGSDPQWTADFATVQARIVQARDALASDDPARAQQALQGVRYILHEVRSRAGVAYFLDAVLGFHEPMERIALAVKDRTPDTLSDSDLAQIRAALPLATQRWQGAAAQPVDAAWPLSAGQRRGIEELVSRQSAQLETLAQALAAGDRAAILSAAQALKPVFSRTYMAFGDFDAVRGGER